MSNSINDKSIYILGGVRTAVGTFGGALKDKAPSELATTVVIEAMKRCNIAPSSIDHVVMGTVIPTTAKDYYLPRIAALNAGIPPTTPAYSVNRLCGSGLQAIVSAAQQIQLGLADRVIGGGAECMSHAPYWLTDHRFGKRMGDSQIVDAMVGPLHCPQNEYHMGVTAENVAARYSVNREDQDQLALQSHQRASNAQRAGYFDDQIVAIDISTRRKQVEFNQDEHIRHDIDLAGLQKLRPVFQKDGSVTAGNASGINDGAAALLMASGASVKADSLTPMAELVDYSVAGVEAAIMGMGPVPAIAKLLEANGLRPEDIDVYEINEAFAAQALAVCRELKLPMDRVNPNGSGISIGHPVGATGAIISLKALYELKRIKGRYAVVSLCIGGGQGIAALFRAC